MKKPDPDRTDIKQGDGWSLQNSFRRKGRVKEENGGHEDPGGYIEIAASLLLTVISFVI